VLWCLLTSTVRRKNNTETSVPISHIGTQSNLGWAKPGSAEPGAVIEKLIKKLTKKLCFGIPVNFKESSTGEVLCSAE
jgi:hypothetical protein